MKKILVFVIFALLILNCSENSSGAKRGVTFTDGSKGEVAIEFVKESAKKESIHLTFTKDKQVIKIAEVDRQVQEIWSQIKKDAETRDIDEALIKYVYIAGIDEESNKPFYHILLFEAERIENGTWTINRVN